MTCVALSTLGGKSATNSKNQPDAVVERINARTNTQFHPHPFILFPVSL